MREAKTIKLTSVNDLFICSSKRNLLLASVKLPRDDVHPALSSIDYFFHLCKDFYT
jgi:hypothetical protein